MTLDESIAMPGCGTANGARCHLGRIEGSCVCVWVWAHWRKAWVWASGYGCLWAGRVLARSSSRNGTGMEGALCLMGVGAEPTKVPFIILASDIPAQW